MDFNIKKPLHVLALILIIITFLIVIVVPILSFIGMSLTTQTVDMQEISESLKSMSEIFILLFQLTLVFGLLVVIPFVWYIIVNECMLKEIFLRLKLKLENIDIAFLWGILAAIFTFVIFFIIVTLLIWLGENPQELGNLPDLERLFSPASLFLLIATQPIAEEIFFRGFLLEKINSFAGKNVAIFSTAVLFGLAHMSYGKIYPVIFPIVMGIFLGFIVIKTKNLFSAIIAHISFNLIVLILSIFARFLQ